MSKEEKAVDTIDDLLEQLLQEMQTEENKDAVMKTFFATSEELASTFSYDK